MYDYTVMDYLDSVIARLHPGEVVVPGSRRQLIVRFRGCEGVIDCGDFRLRVREQWS